ncbi:MAG: c-type cytochrome [Betaproteobacteria bacterium]
MRRVIDDAHVTMPGPTMSDEHSSFLKTPKQLAIVMVLAFAIPIVLIALLSQLVTGLMPMGHTEVEDKLISRIQPVGVLAFADSTPAGNKTGEQVYQAVCKTCHDGGLAGAPKFADKAAWAAPIKSGLPTLLKHAINGFQESGKVMPPKGGNPDLTDIEVARAVVYMANVAGAAFKEPAAPAPVAGPSVVVTPIATAAAATPPVAPASAAPVAAPAPPPAPGPSAALDMQSGMTMMQKDGCAACHAVDKKIVGPSYQEVAAKYRGDKDAAAKLVQKVKNGGSGVWGQVPMPPNVQVPESDIKALVSWILSQKK